MTEIRNRQKRMALINDISGFGRCSITVALPIISYLKIQCCPLPTSIFSNHTAYPSYYFEDFTNQMLPYMQEWKKLGLQFDAIYTGFLGSLEQIAIVSSFFQMFKREDTLVIVDPVMGDWGKPYSTYTDDMCREFKNLVQYADILTPNLTEACILTDTPYKERFRQQEVVDIAEKLSMMGPTKIVITGIPQKSYIANLCYEKEKEPCFRKSHKIGTERSGTGDVFSSVIAADAVNQIPFDESVKRASSFVKKCIQKSIEYDIPPNDGVCFEEVLTSL